MIAAKNLKLLEALEATQNFAARQDLLKEIWREEQAEKNAAEQQRQQESDSE